MKISFRKLAKSLLSPFFKILGWGCVTKFGQTVINTLATKRPKRCHVAVTYSGYQMSITEKKETNCQQWMWLMDSWWSSPSPQAMTWPTNGPLLPALKPFTVNIQDTSIQSLLLHIFVVGQKFRRATLLADIAARQDSQLTTECWIKTACEHWDWSIPSTIWCL